MPLQKLDLALFAKQTRDAVPSGVLRARRAETQYASNLRRIARTVGEIVNGIGANSPEAITEALTRYSQAIGPWASAVARRMLKDVASREYAWWRERSAAMSRALRSEILNAPTGRVMQQRLDEQVDLITSLPRDAGQRVHKLAMEGRVTGRRAEDIAKEIMASGEVTESRAKLIARTEVSRTATELTRARMLHIGAETYIWRTAGDTDVRPGHKRLNGTVQRWDSPPECDPGYKAHPGGIFNCRCIPVPILPED